MLLLLSLGLKAQADGDTLFTYATQQIYENPDISIKIAKELLDKSGATADDKIRAILIISTAYSSKREYEKAMDYALSAMDLLPNLKNVNLRINLFNRIGGLYQELQIYDKAILYLDRALETINKLPEGETKSRNLGINNLLRGFVYRDQMSCEIALNYFEKGIEDYKKFPDSPGGNANISISYYSRGDCLVELGKIDEAENNFHLSLDYAKKANAISAIAFAEKGLAQVYTVKGEYLKSINLLTETLKNTEKVGDKVLNRELYDALSANYLATGDFEHYSHYRNQSIRMHNEIKRTERKTVDESIMDLISLNSEKTAQLEKKTKTIKIIFSILILVTFILLMRSIILSQKRLKSLTNRLKI
ncbi:tetratricopeptide repeat protein [Aequorivita sp. H23M31]|uniref:Tetratricopeptide repeat protein n=1 Tax=Aequorivita ciconiae TaxID=2494375 RepID=A0A410G6V5_9FLAO|nr:tetratricopeptide repeat protein [Aequorivita sp. H23M31]QAA83029.1 tetratricopeptide repeat protein [Aequorivita sp. H23M31]